MRKKFRYSYTIYNIPDDDLFTKQCEAIEKNIHGLTKERLLEDVDGSKYQHYRHKNGEIRVCNDYDIYCLYVDSDFDLLPYFKKND